MAIQDWLNNLLEGNAGPWEMALALVLATFVTEDATCVFAGFLVAGERLSFPLASGACALGIFLGDVGLYWVGRGTALGLLRWRWVRQRMPADGGERWRSLFDRRGIQILVASRFLPGTRLATYLTAGAVGWSFPRFAMILGAAVLVWTPVLVGLSTWLGDTAMDWLDAYGSYGWLAVVAALIGTWLLVRTVPLLMTWKGRRLLYGRWLRWTRFEYAGRLWVYTPVVVSLVWRWFTRGRCFTDAPCMFTACNPGIPHGGIVGESKGDILDQMPTAAEVGGSEPPVMVARYKVLKKDTPLADRMATVGQWLRQGPVVLKPNQGERGNGVAIIRKEDEARSWLERCPQDGILQEYIQGEEFGVVWRRVQPSGDASKPPGSEVRSIACKIPPKITGDGVRTEMELILADPRHVAMARYHIARRGEDAEEIPGVGEERSLGELGTHCRGAAFLDGNHLHTEALVDALDRFMANCPGLDFGRFDLRAPDASAFQAGRGIRILEFNGVTGEPAHIYAPGGSWWRGVRALCQHWWAASATGEANRRNGHRTTPGLQLLREALASRKLESFEADPRDMER